MRDWLIGLIGLLSPLLCAGLWSWGTYHLAVKGCSGPVQRPSEREHPAVLCKAFAICTVITTGNYFRRNQVFINIVATNAPGVKPPVHQRKKYSLNTMGCGSSSATNTARLKHSCRLIQLKCKSEIKEVHDKTSSIEYHVRNSHHRK